MDWLEKHRIRQDSKSIALLAVFTAIVIALEAFPIPGVTDIPIDPSGRFTLDPTGIPIVIIFIGLGFVFSIIAITAMWVAIGYRNFIGAAFKGFAELFTILGLLSARLISTRLNLSKRSRVLVFVIFGTIFRDTGMFFTNIFLLQLFYGLPLDAAIIGSAAYLFLNTIQAIINIMAGIILYQFIPEDLKAQAGLGDGADMASGQIEELSNEEINEE